MKLEEIKRMNIPYTQPIEVCILSDEGLEYKVGYFFGLNELPEGMTEIPEEFKDAYPVKPPYIIIAYCLDRNGCAKVAEEYKPEQIEWLRILKY